MSRVSRAKKIYDVAIKKTNKLPDSWFGEAQVSLDDLPSVRRSKRVRKNIFVEQETAEALDEFCQKNQVSFTDVANDILTKYVDAQKKKKVG